MAKKTRKPKAEKATAPQTGVENTSAKPFESPRAGLTRVTITKPVAGKYLLPWNIGQTVFIKTAQAKEMIENGDAILAE